MGWESSSIHVCFYKKQIEVMEEEEAKKESFLLLQREWGRTRQNSMCLTIKWKDPKQKNSP